MPRTPPRYVPGPRERRSGRAPKPVPRDAITLPRWPACSCGCGQERVPGMTLSSRCLQERFASKDPAP